MPPKFQKDKSIASGDSKQKKVLSSSSAPAPAPILIDFLQDDHNYLINDLMEKLGLRLDDFKKKRKIITWLSKLPPEEKIDFVKHSTEHLRNTPNVPVERLAGLTVTDSLPLGEAIIYISAHKRFSILGALDTINALMDPNINKSDVDVIQYVYKCKKRTLLPSEFFYPDTKVVQKTSSNPPYEHSSSVSNDNNTNNHNSTLPPLVFPYPDLPPPLATRTNFSWPSNNPSFGGYSPTSQGSGEYNHCPTTCEHSSSVSSNNTNNHNSTLSPLVSPYPDLPPPLMIPNFLGSSYEHSSSVSNNNTNNHNSTLPPLVFPYPAPPPPLAAWTNFCWPWNNPSFGGYSPTSQGSGEYNHCPTTLVPGPDTLTHVPNNQLSKASSSLAHTEHYLRSP